MPQFYLQPLYLITTVLLISVSVLSAGAEQPAQEPENAVTVMPQVTVTAQKVATFPGTSVFTEEQIEKLPNKNSTITDYLKVTPGTHFSEGSDSSFQAGEIKPEKVSISGGRSYENNFLIDGISNSSNLDPAADKFDDPNFLPNHPEKIFLSSSLVKKLTVLDHNISARYGNFTGGVVEADTIDPAEVLSGEIAYRTTRDKWAKFFVHPEDQEDFDLAARTTRQRRFEKHYVDLQFGGPINESNGLLFAYSLAYARIPLNPFGEKETQTRRSENYFLKHVKDLSPSRTIKTTFIYSPYREKGFLNRTKDSGFENSNVTYAAHSEVIKTSPTGTTELKAAISSNINEREAPKDFFSWKSSFGPTKDWGLFFSPTAFSNEGGFGDLRRTEHSFNLQGHWSISPRTAGFTNTTINSGLEYELTRAKYSRPQNRFTYNVPKALAAGDICLPDDPACVDEEQYLSKRLVYPAGSESEQVNAASAYAEIIQNVRRLTIRPGLRISYDDLMKNFNPAPRLSVSLDLWGNGKTILAAGANRYYSQNLLAAKLRGAVQPLAEQKRTDHLTMFPGPETAQQIIGNSQWRFSDLKTPHSDELSVGISQQILSSQLSLDYVQRDNKDQLAKEVDPFDPLNNRETRLITLNNNGRSEYQSYRLAWEKHWLKYSLTINATYEEITSSNESYDVTFDEEDTEDLVYYKGELKSKDELPREDFSRPWTINLIYFADLPFGFSFTNTTRYHSRYKILEKSKEDPKTISIDGEDYDRYVKTLKPESLTFDWRITWEKKFINQKALELNVDIYNVFNRKVYIGTEEDKFKLGRQYWAGLSYKF